MRSYMSNFFIVIFRECLKAMTILPGQFQVTGFLRATHFSPSISNIGALRLSVCITDRPLGSYGTFVPLAFFSQVETHDHGPARKARHFVNYGVLAQLQYGIGVYKKTSGYLLIIIRNIDSDCSAVFAGKK